VIEEQRPGANGTVRTVYRVDEQLAADFARQCDYVDQRRSSKIGARQRPLFEQMKRDAAARKFDRLLVWKVSRLGRDMREVISTVYQLADLGITEARPRCEVEERYQRFIPDYGKLNPVTRSDADDGFRRKVNKYLQSHRRLREGR
jgi:hypothetical protein